MKAGTIIILFFIVVLFAAIVYTAMQVKSAVDSTKIINTTEVLYESPVGKAFSPFAPVILIAFGAACLIVLISKRL